MLIIKDVYRIDLRKKDLWLDLLTKRNFDEVVSINLVPIRGLVFIYTR